MGLAGKERELTAAGQGCLGKAADNEPVFILRAQDILAADLVDTWATQAKTLGVDWDKVREAREIAQAMREWPQRKNPD